MMFRLLFAAVLTVLFLAAPCLAQFFDDFDGNALAPHWVMEPAPGTIEHHVSGGIMHVTNVLFPSMPKIPTNSAFIRATFTPIAGEVLARAIVGWDPGVDRQMTFRVTSNLSLVAQMRYSDLGTISFTAGGGITDSFPAPPPGMHEFMMIRHAAGGGAMNISAYLNGELLVTRPAVVLGPVSATSLTFTVRYPNSGMQPMHVDRVHIVPAPGAPAIMLACVCAAARRGKRVARTKGIR